MKDDPHKRGTPVDVRYPPAERAALYDKHRHAAELRRAGWTWDEVAAEVGYANRGSAYRAVRDLMVESRELAYGEADLYRIESLERLTALLKAVWPMAMKGSDKHVESARRLIKQMGDLRGENLPIQVEIGMSDVDRLLREAEAELGRRSAAAQVEAARLQADAAADRRS